MAQVKFHKFVAALPAELEADAIYYVRSGAGFDIYVTNSSGVVVAYPLNVGGPGQAFFRTEPITATAAGQTVFTVPGGYTPGAVIVSLNGASLPPADYTAADGTTVALASGAGIVAGSVLLVYVLSAFEVAVGGGGGEANTASNLGAGEGLYASKVGVDLRFKSLVAGTNVSLSSDGDTVTIDATGGGGGSGTVTSVALSAPTGFDVSGSPVTASGTLALSFSTGYSLPTNANQANWSAAFGWGSHAIAGYEKQLTAGANITIDRTDPDNPIISSTASGGGGGLTLFEESRNTTSPNATVPVHALTALGAETNIDFVISPKGTGAIIAQVPDGTAAGGNKRGVRAVDLQLSRSSADQVASGESSVAIGRSGTASGAYSTAAGSFAKSLGTYSVAMGYSPNAGAVRSVAIGSGVTASGTSSVAIGTSVTASGESSLAIGVWATASGANSAAIGPYSAASGDSSVAIGFRTATRLTVGAMSEGNSGVIGQQQMERIPLRYDTTSATSQQLSTTGGPLSTTNSAVMPNNSAYYCRLRVLARNTSTNESMSWSGTALIKRGANAASTTLIGSTIASDFGDAAMSACTVTLSADTTRGALAVIVTGLASTSIRWVAQLETVEAA